MVRNKNLIKKINNAFLNGDIKFVSTHLADDIQWNIVGMPVIKGKNDFLVTMEIMESAVGGFNDIDIKNVVAEGDYVVVESHGNAGVKTSNPSYCDVYHIINGKIKELTTYIVDIA